MKFVAMFQPIQIGPVTVKNRFVVPPMGNNFANTDGTMSEQSVAYYRERAKGGFGLITIEATVVHKGAKGGPRKPCLYDDSTIESFKKVVDACHAEGAKVSVQLQNAGPEGNAKNAGKIIPVPLGMKLTPLDIKLSDSQFIELKKYSALQIAAAFGIKPNQINDYTKSSYSNSEMQQLSFLTDTMLFVLKQYEEEVNYKLLTDISIHAPARGATRSEVFC